MDAQSRSRRLFEAMHKMQQTHFGMEQLGTPPQAEMMTMGVIMEMEKKDAGGAPRVSDLAKRLNISAPAVSRTLNTLEKKGWIKRETGQHDRRSTHVFLTDEGKETLCGCMKEMSEYTDSALQRLDEGEFETFMTLLQKVFDGFHCEMEKMKERNSNTSCSKS